MMQTEWKSPRILKSQARRIKFRRLGGSAAAAPAYDIYMYCERLCFHCSACGWIPGCGDARFYSKLLLKAESSWTAGLIKNREQLLLREPATTTGSSDSARSRTRSPSLWISLGDVKMWSLHLQGAFNAKRRTSEGSLLRGAALSVLGIAIESVLNYFWCYGLGHCQPELHLVHDRNQRFKAAARHIVNSNHYTHHPGAGTAKNKTDQLVTHKLLHTYTDS